MKFRALFFVCIIAAFAWSCGSDGNEAASNDAAVDSMLDFLDEKMPENPWLAHYDSMPPGGRRLHVNFKAAVGREFNDSNHVHLSVAREIGIDPIASPADVWKITRGMRKIETTENVFVDSLTHSLPFLVNEAADLLEDIGRSFRDSLIARGGGDYRIKTTSILRTPATVKSLRRRNRNAVDSSAHCFGTTFDVSYVKFICNDPSIPRTQEDLKNLLAEILSDYRDRGLCYVKYERRQGCFHITARPRN